MEKARFEIIGVYSVPADEPVYLIESRIHDSPGMFDLERVTQDSAEGDRSNWQVPYMEHILNDAGTEVLAGPKTASQKPQLWKGLLRIAFFFHYLDLGLKLRTPFGDVPLPRPTRMPDRLKIVKYEPPY